MLSSSHQGVWATPCNGMCTLLLAALLPFLLQLPLLACLEAYAPMHLAAALHRPSTLSWAIPATCLCLSAPPSLDQPHLSSVRTHWAAT